MITKQTAKDLNDLTESKPVMYVYVALVAFLLAGVVAVALVRAKTAE